MLIIAGSVQVPHERRDTLVAAFEDLVRRARTAPGCLDVAVTADSIDPGRINNFELWESQDHLDAWRAVAHAPDVSAEMISVDVSLFDVSGERPPF